MRRRRCWIRRRWFQMELEETSLGVSGRRCKCTMHSVVVDRVGPDWRHRCYCMAECRSITVPIIVSSVWERERIPWHVYYSRQSVCYEKVQGCLGSRAGSLDSVVMASLVRGGSRAGWVSEQKPGVGGAWLLVAGRAVMTVGRSCRLQASHDSRSCRTAQEDSRRRYRIPGPNSGAGCLRRRRALAAG